jgi:Glycosyl hydrolases family 2, TIM barrel domain
MIRDADTRGPGPSTASATDDASAPPPQPQRPGDRRQMRPRALAAPARLGARAFAAPMRLCAPALAAPGRLGAPARAAIARLRAPVRAAGARLPAPLPALIEATLAYALLYPLLTLLHACTILATASALHALAAGGLLDRLAALGPGDPVYKSVVLWTLAGIEPQGIAVVEPLGGWLHAHAGAVFAAPALLPADHWLSAAVADGATLMAELLTRTLGNLAIVAVGGGLLFAPHRARRGWRLDWPTLLAGLILLRGALGLARLAAQLTPHQLEILGLVHVLSKTFRWTPRDYADHLRLLPATLLECATLVVLALIAVSLWRHGRGARTTAGPAPRPRATLAARRRVLAHAGLLAAWATLMLVAPTRGLAGADPMLETTPAATEVVAEDAGDGAVGGSGPTVVAIQGTPFDYQYTVNGVRQVVRGIGYNVPYADRDRDWRARRYDRDFAMMAAAGFNTLIGWDEREFDDLTLDKAQQYGLGVAWPYDFPADGDWTDPAYRAAQRERVLGFVARYMNHPALRMWGLGNEVFHDMPEEDRPERARAFADFYADVVVAVHALDPNHPVLYRDSEDVWFEPVRQALVDRGLEQPWLVYGANIFTFRLRELVEGWPERGLRVPLLISEYGPTGYAPADRPGAMLGMWDLIRQHREYVLGGSIYAWTTDGIEAIDRVYGLVDDDGQPVDGALAAIADRYATARKRCPAAPCSGSAARDATPSGGAGAAQSPSDSARAAGANPAGH